MTKVYYNEFDQYAADWLENLIKAGLIADGIVDRRSIVDVQPEDLKGFAQCHFFAGIGVWSHALRLAGIRDDEQVWTGSCPCQPFSSAGQGKGFNDERHLWPDFFRLIDACKPERVMGEQVASKDGLAWLDLVYDDLEGTDYSVRAVDTCSAGFGAPHIRQRLYWVADSTSPGLERHRGSFQGYDSEGRKIQNGHNREVRVCVGLADSNGGNSCSERQQCSREQRLFSESRECIGLADSASARLEIRPSEQGGSGGSEFGFERLLTTNQLEGGRRPFPTNGFWRDVDWLFCTDGKWRPVESSTFPLAHGATARMGRLRAYGNAINARQAAAFIESVW